MCVCREYIRVRVCAGPVCVDVCVDECVSVLGMCVRVGRVCWVCICVRVCVGYMHMSTCWTCVCVWRVCVHVHIG